MALLPKNKTPKAGVGFMSLGNVSDLLAEQTVKREERQRTQVESTVQSQQAASKARREANIIRDQAQADSAAIQQQQLEILGGINGQIAKAQEAIRLSDSDNPMDRLSLWFLQQQDPSYTREGNLARMSYLQSAAAGLGDVSAIQQQGYAEAIAGLQADLNDTLAEQDDRLALAKLSEDQGQELIDAELQAQNTRLGIMQTQNSMQVAAMVNMTDEQVEAAIERASTSPTQTLNVGGIDVSLAQLQARKQVIDDRRYNQAVQSNAMATTALQNMTREQVEELQAQAVGSKDRIVDAGNGVQISLGAIQDRLFQLNQQDYTTTAQTMSMMEQREALLVKSQDRILGGMEVMELQEIIANGYKDEFGVSYDPARVRLARDARAEHDTMIATQNAQQAAMTAPAAQGAAANQLIDEVKANLLPGSPASVALEESRAAVAHATKMLANPANPSEVTTGQLLMQAARESIDSTIASEAKRLSDNDKDLEAAYNYQLRGQPIPQDLIEENILTRAKKGQNVGRWLSGNNRALYTSTFQSTKAALMNPMDGSMRLDAETAEAQAHEQAMQVVMQAVANPLSDQLMIAQISQEGHPLRGVINTSDFASMLRNADDQGFKVYAESSEHTTEELAAIKSGAQSDPALVAAQNSALYQALERKRPGLGDAYIEWWSSPARNEWVDRFTQATLADAADDFSKTAELSLVMPHLQDVMGAQANFLVDGRNNTFMQDIQNQHAQYVTFGNNSTAKQIFLIEQTPNLTTQEKQIAMQTVIQPLLDQAQQNGMQNMEQVSLFVETQLRTFEPESPQGRRVLGKMLAGRDTALKVIDDLINIGTPRFNALAMAGAGGAAVKALSADVDNAANLPWYQQYMKSGVQASMNRGME